MIKELEQYQWSSYYAYIEKIKAPSWLIRDEIYGQLTQHHSKVISYKRFMKETEINEDVLEFYTTPSLPPILGGNDFLRSLNLNKPSQEVPRKQRAIARPSMPTILREVSKYMGVNLKTLITVKKGPHALNPARKMAMYIAKNHGNYQLKEIAEVFGLTHYGSVSYAIHTFKQEIKTNTVLLENFENVLEKLAC